MATTVWRRFSDAFSQIRCEDMDSARHVRFEEHNEVEETHKKKKKIYEDTLTDLAEDKAAKITEYVENLKEREYMLQKEAYCEGYVDCIQLLIGLGLLDAFKHDEIIKRIIK